MNKENNLALTTLAISTAVMFSSVLVIVVSISENITASL